MIIAILVVDFKLRGAFFSDFFLVCIEIVQFACAVRTFLVMAFINSNFRALFPGKERFEAIRTKIFDFIKETFVKLKGVFTDFAFELGSFLAIIEINVFMRRLAVRAFGLFRNTVVSVSNVYRFKRFTVS
ncbi:MAG: hypothetical protein H8D45_02850 [Bacteroidetes bacterium]|nr:hypothetical protein [Bacteroidota bacterium]